MIRPAPQSAPRHRRHALARALLPSLLLLAAGCVMPPVSPALPAPPGAADAVVLDPRDPAGCPWEQPIEVVGDYPTAEAGGSEVIVERPGTHSGDPVLVRLRSHRERSGGVQFDAAGTLFLTSGVDDRENGAATYAVRLWASAGGALLYEWAPGELLANALLSPSGNLIAASGWDADVGQGVTLVRDRRADERTLTLAAERPLAFDPAGQLLAAARRDAASQVPTVTLWEVESGRLRHTLAAVTEQDADGLVQGAFGHFGSIVSARFDAGGARLVTIGHDDAVRVWDTATGAHIRCFEGGGGADRAWFGADGNTVYAASRSRLFAWELDSGAPHAALPIDCLTSACDFSTDLARYVAYGKWHGLPVTLVRESGSGALLALLYTREEVDAALFSPDGRTVLTAVDTPALPATSSGDGEVAPPDVLLWDSTHPVVRGLVQHAELVDAATAALVDGQAERARGYLARAAAFAPPDAPDMTALRLAHNVEEAIVRGTWQGASVADAEALVQAAEAVLPGIDLQSAWYSLCALRMEPDLCARAGLSVPPGEWAWTPAYLDSGGADVPVRSRPDLEGRVLYQLEPYSEVALLAADEAGGWLFVLAEPGPGWLAGALDAGGWIVTAPQP